MEKTRLISLSIFLIILFLVGCANENVVNNEDVGLPDKVVCNQNKLDQKKCVTDNNKVQVKFNSLEISDAIIKDKTYGVASATTFLRARGEIGASQSIGVVNGELYVYESVGVGISASAGAELSSRITTDYKVTYPKNNHYFVIVDTTIENLNYQDKYGNSEEERNTLYLYYTEFQLYDTEDYSYKPNSPSGDEKIIPANIHIIKGDRFRGKLIYEIPKESNIIELMLKGGSSSGKRDIGTLKLDISSIYSEKKDDFVSLNQEISGLKGKVEGTDTQSKDGLEKLKEELFNSPSQITIIQNQDGTFTCPDDSVVSDGTDCY